jgi:gamma-glutamylcyclotransferase (GGCT)/AIG2-like uncharacterized protein YtfP
MRDGCRQAVLARQRFLGQLHTLPLYDLLDLGSYPGLIHTKAPGRAIAGEVYEVASSLRPVLDRIEGAPDLFRLEPVAVAGMVGTIFAYFYVPDPAGLTRYPGDRWHNRL